MLPVGRLRSVAVDSVYYKRREEVIREAVIREAVIREEVIREAVIKS